MTEYDTSDFERTCMATIKTFNNTIWESRVENDDVTVWLTNFDSESDKRTALYILSRFMYFGSRQIRELLKVLFRDIFKYKIVRAIRENHSGTLDPKIIHKEFEIQLRATRFLGIGNPSESGAHLLYYFRQINRLANQLFINAHEAFKPRSRSNPLDLEDSSVKRFVFIDDFAGSGHQGVSYSNSIVSDLKAASEEIEVWYLVLFCTEKARVYLNNNSMFDFIDCIYELDDSFRAFSNQSRYFHDSVNLVDKQLAKHTCHNYGHKLLPSAPLGYEDCQLLIGFHHNTPDNTLPIFWFDEPSGFPWNPIFPRFQKLYYSL